MSNPKSTTCPACNGEGFRWQLDGSAGKTCPTCHGSGSTPAVQPESSDSQRHETLESNSIEFDNIESDHLRDAKEVITTPSKAGSKYDVDLSYKAHYPAKLYINKWVAESFARDIPLQCPNCPSGANFILTEVSDTGIGTNSYLSHLCGWTKEITDYNLW